MTDLQSKSSSHDIRSDLVYHGVMRTTVTIDDDLADQIQELRRRHGHSLKRIINSLLREGLHSLQSRPRAKKYRTRNLRTRHAARDFDPVKLNQLVDELEAERWLAQEQGVAR